MSPEEQRLLERALNTFPQDVRHALPPESLTSLRDQIDALLKISQTEFPQHNWAPLSYFAGAGHLQKVTDLLSAFLLAPGFAATRPHVGDEVVVLLNHCIVRRRDVGNSSDRSPWHLDADFMGAEGEMLNAWMPLVDVGMDCPGLDFLVDRQATITVWKRWLADRGGKAGTDEDVLQHWQGGTAESLTALIGRDPAELTRTTKLGAGDAVLFNQAILHRTQELEGPVKPRYSIELRMAAKDRIPSSYRDSLMGLAIVTRSEDVRLRYLTSDLLDA